MGVGRTSLIPQSVPARGARCSEICVHSRIYQSDREAGKNTGRPEKSVVVATTYGPHRRHALPYACDSGRASPAVQRGKHQVSVHACSASRSRAKPAYAVAASCSGDLSARGAGVETARHQALTAPQRRRDRSVVAVSPTRSVAVTVRNNSA